MDLIPYKAFHDFRDIVDIMDHTSQEVYAQKYQALINGNEHLKSSIGEGKDVMSLLSELSRPVSLPQTAYEQISYQCEPISPWTRTKDYRKVNYWVR